MTMKQEIVKLPRPRFQGPMSVEEALAARRTIRNFSSKELTLPQLSQLLWALQGITYIEDLPGGGTLHHRAAPSAGRTFPLEVYTAIPAGLYHYKPHEHELHRVSDVDLRAKLSEAALSESNREAIKTAPLTVVLAADNSRALKATPIMESALRYVHLEAGHAAQNLALQAASLGLGICTITSYQVAKVYDALKLPLNHRPIYLLPVGFPMES